MQLASDDEKKLKFELLSHKFETLMKALFRQKGAQLDINILATDKAQDFIDTHASILDSTFEQTKMSDRMRERLTRSNYIFSGMKTFHELNEAFPSLLDENGDRKTFEHFLNDVQTINETYNRNYLRAEYNFVHQSAQMASRWEQFEEDGDRYYLQYRTAGDDKVRPEHAALDRITLPMSDPFWESYYPPNGWNCRCTVVQVLKWKYDRTDPRQAQDRGKEALDGERFNIFRFNSGKQQKAVPDYNPYTIKRCNDCDVARGGNTKLAFAPSNEVCAACQLLQRCVNDKEKSKSAIERMHYTQKEMNHLLKAKVTKNIDDKDVTVRFDINCIKHLYSDAKSRSRRLRLDDLKGIHLLLEKATYTNNAPSETGHHNGFEHFYYFETELSGKKIRLNVGKKIRKKGNGQKVATYYCYSINDVKQKEEPKGGN